MVLVLKGDCLEQMKTLPDNSVDTIITDPPYGLSFMGKKWDYDVPSVEVWSECLRVLKPGGTALIFAGSRTQHRMAVNVEDAGFVLKDTIMYMYGSGFPKSHNISKALIKTFKYECGLMSVYELEKTHKTTEQNTKYYLRPMSEEDISKTLNTENKQRKVLQSELSEQSISKSRNTTSNVRGEEPSMERWSYIQTSERELQKCKICSMSKKVIIDGEEGWVCNGTPFDYGSKNWKSIKEDRSCSSYRPQSNEQQNEQPNVISKQFSTQKIRSHSQNWSGWGTALKPSYEPILVCVKPNEGTYAANALKWGVSGLNIDGGRIPGMDTRQKTGGAPEGSGWGTKKDAVAGSELGRFPANIILDEEAGALLDQQSGELYSGKQTNNNYKTQAKTELSKANLVSKEITINRFGDKGGASRFFYCAKASKSERNAGCEELEEKSNQDGDDRTGQNNSSKRPDGSDRKPVKAKNHHPTVKPLKLMEYLCTLTKTPTGGLVLDPFAGSGTTGVACQNTGRPFILIEREAEYIDIINYRLTHIEEEIEEEIKEKKSQKGVFDYA